MPPYLKNAGWLFDPWICEWQTVQFCVRMLVCVCGPVGMLGSSSTLRMFVWHSRHICLTELRFSIFGLFEPCGVWQAAHPSVLSGACSNANGPCIWVWHLTQD